MELLNSERLYSNIFVNAIVAIGVTDISGKFMIVNPTWCDLLGYSEEEATSLYINDVTPREDWETSIISFDYLIAQRGRQIRKQRRYQRKDGTIFWADLHASSLFDEHENPLGILGVFVDIEKQMLAEQVQKDLYEHLENLNRELSLANADLKRLSRHDPLTGLYNRCVLEDLMVQETSRSMRTKRGFAIAIADIDNFKKINDTYGHDCGDLVLKSLAGLFLKGVRITDTVGRWGGEEFTFVFTETTCKGAMTVIERIRQAVERMVLSCGENKLKITITIGLSYHEGEDTAADLLNEADIALYRGKNSGKNRVVCYQDTYGRQLSEIQL